MVLTILPVAKKDYSFTGSGSAERPRGITALHHFGPFHLMNSLENGPSESDTHRSMFTRKGV
jgi:hypothetical protein